MLKKRDNLDSISHGIYTKIRELITYGELGPGEKISESKLVKDFNVSRTPVREAIRQLEVKGYLTLIHNKGTYVRKISWEEVGNIYDVISVLEGYSARLAAENITHQQIDQLEKTNEALGELNNLSKYKEYTERNLEFHYFLSSIFANEILQTLIKELRDRVYRYRFIGITIPAHIEEYLLDHKAIINALKEKDPTKAEENMRRHIQRVKQILVNFLREFSA